VSSTSLKEKAIELVTDYWRKFNAAYLLSALGPALTRSGYNHRLILGERKLSDFITEDCRDVLQIVKNPSDPLVLGVIPAHVTISPEHAPSLFLRRPDVPRFPKGVWSAFLVELKPRFRRYVNTTPPYNFEDVPEFNPPPGPEYVEVDRKHIRQPYEDFVPSEKTLERIQQWAMEKLIDVRQIELVSSSRHEAVDHATSGPARSMLEAIYAVLSEEERRRLSIPLDIMKKLSEPWKGN
jgi:hypothetical protein